MTRYNIRRVQATRLIKERDGYTFYDETDEAMYDVKTMVKLALGCMFAATLCGCTGIAGGMVLAPLFFAYNMIPEVVAGTNQYISMVATLSVTFQLIYLGKLDYRYGILSAIVCTLSAWLAIKTINDYI